VADKVAFVGLREFQRALRQIDPDLRKELREVQKEAAQIVAVTAAARAPRRTGRLAGSIRATATQKAGSVRAGGARLPYAGPIHFGWRARNIRPQPFIYDALDARREQVVRKFESGIESLFRKAGLK